MENRIKEQQLGLFADRTSTRKLAGNQLRLYFSAFAYVMMETLRRVGLAGTKLARAQSWTLRVRLLKIGAQVRITSRKVWLSFSESYAVCGAVEDGSDASASPPASLLATDGKNSLDDGDLGVPRMDCAPEWAPGRESSLRSAGWASKGSGEALHLAVGRHVRAPKTAS